MKGLLLFAILLRILTAFCQAGSVNDRNERDKHLDELLEKIEEILNPTIQRKTSTGTVCYLMIQSTCNLLNPVLRNPDFKVHVKCLTVAM